MTSFRPTLLALGFAAACLAACLAACASNSLAPVEDAVAVAPPVDVLAPPPVDATAPPPGPDGALPDSAPPVGAVTCFDPVPPGAPEPPPLPLYSGGTCPTIAPGRNTITSGGASREFLLVVPEDRDPARPLPVLVMWHHIGGDATAILDDGQVQSAANTLRFIAVIPEKSGTMTIPFTEWDMAWPYLTIHSGSIDAEALLFDDMLACVAAQVPIIPSCVSTLGVSAGALWVAQLAQVRSERLASAIVISGGVGPAFDFGFGVDVMPWKGSSRAMPQLVVWGGADDQCGVDFALASGNLEVGLIAGGHFVMECVHNCGHAVPPMDPAVGLGALYRFALDHPYWIPAGQSPYLGAGLPPGTPDWCALGAGSATPRTGDCLTTSVDSGCPTI